MRLLLRIPDAWRERLDNWRLWMGVAYFGIVFVIVGLMFVNQKTTRTLAKQTAASVATYNRCIASIPALKELSIHLKGVDQLARILTINTGAALAATDPSDPLYQARKASLARLEKARKEISAVSSFPVPTMQQCRNESR